MDPHPHGGSLARARARFPDAPEPRLDLSTGINPTAYPAPRARLDRLPEPADLDALEAAAAAAYALPPEARTVAGPGTGLLMTLVALLSQARTVAIVGPTYAGHARAWSAAGARIHDVPSIEAARATNARAIVVTRPNNPDGRLAEASDLVADPARLLIVDEAFADLEPCAHDLTARATAPGLILLRSFGKTYGLPGVRLAFALGADPLLARLRDALGPWPVSAHALAAGLAALPDAAWRATQRDTLARSAARLDTLLTRAGLEVEGGTTLFRLASHPRATALWEHLGRAGILVRRFPDRPDRLRFGIPPAGAARARLARALENEPWKTGPATNRCNPVSSRTKRARRSSDPLMSITIEPVGLPAPTRTYGHLNAETVLSVQRWTDRLFSFRTTRDPSLRFENGQFTMIGIEVEGKPLLRAYSMASANYEEHLEFLSIQVPDGPLTSRLGHVRVGDTVLVGRKPVGTLVLDNLKGGRNLYLLATGTGLAPFMALIHDPAVYERFEHVVLTHTCRTADELAYRAYIRDELPKHELLGEFIEGKLLYYPSVTREEFQTSGRITELFRSGKLFADLGLPRADHALDRAMICGNERMLADCEAMLVERDFIEGHNAEPGEYVIEKAFVEK